MTHGTVQLHVYPFGHFVEQLTVTVGEEGVVARELGMVVVVVPVERRYLPRDQVMSTTLRLHDTNRQAV